LLAQDRSSEGQETVKAWIAYWLIQRARACLIGRELKMTPAFTPLAPYDHEVGFLKDFQLLHDRAAIHFRERFAQRPGGSGCLGWASALKTPDILSQDRRYPFMDL
jgi:hypothetical protein